MMGSGSLPQRPSGDQSRSVAALPAEVTSFMLGH